MTVTPRESESDEPAADAWISADPSRNADGDGRHHCAARDINRPKEKPF